MDINSYKSTLPPKKYVNNEVLSRAIFGFPSLLLTVMPLSWYKSFMDAAKTEISPISRIEILMIFLNTAMITGIMLGLTDSLGNYKWLLSHNDVAIGLTILAIVIITSLFEVLGIIFVLLSYAGLVLMISAKIRPKISNFVRKLAVFIPVSVYILLMSVALFSGHSLQRAGISTYLQAGTWITGSAIVWLWIRRAGNPVVMMDMSVFRQAGFFLSFLILATVDIFMYRGLYHAVHNLLIPVLAILLFLALLPLVRRFIQPSNSIRGPVFILVFIAILAVGGDYLLYGDEGIQHDIIDESVFAGPLVNRLLQNSNSASGFATSLLSNRLAFDRHDPAVDALKSGTCAKRTPNILLITVETTRFDHTTNGGYSRNTTPNLAAFARGAILFSSAYAAFPSTEYSMISMMIGLPLKLMFRFSPRGNYLAFPELLDLAGYETACYFPFRKHFRRTPGGIYYFYHLFGCKEIHENILPANLLTDKLLSRVKDRDSGPLFIWAHYVDPHSPYFEHRGFDFGSRPIDRYDSEIAFTDANIGRLLKQIDKEPRPWVVIIASDHGEEFGEHGHFGHASALYEQQEHIMFMMRFPGVRPRVYSGPVCLTDVMPTILDFIGIPRPESCAGADLLTLITQNTPRKSIVASLENKVMVRDSGWKLIRQSNTGTRELYSMLPHPDEFKNQVMARPGLTARLSRELKVWLDRLRQKADLNKKTTH